MSITPSTSNYFKTDLYALNNIVQNTMLSYPKELIIGLVRDEFAKDSYYHYVSDEWGFPKTPDHTDLPYDAGVNDELTTRIFIGEAFRQDVIFYPSIIVKAGSVNSVPISLNRNKYVVEYEPILLIDGYGNQRAIQIPSYFAMTGAWTGSISLDVTARDLISRDEIVSFLMIFFTDLAFETCAKAGVVITKVAASGPSEGEDRQQEKIYKQSVTLDIRTEWRRNIPIRDLVDQINVCVDIKSESGLPSPNLEIRESIDLLAEISAL